MTRSGPAQTFLPVMMPGQLITTHTWNQQLVREGKPMKPAPLKVDFNHAGKYRFSLSRWPRESELALSAPSLDNYEATDYTNANISGKAMKFKKAYLKIGNRQIETAVDNTKNASVLEIDVVSGETDLTAYFDSENDGQTNAFYIYVNRIE